MQTMLSNTPSGSGDVTKQVHQAACDWLQDNVDVWRPWIEQAERDCPVDDVDIASTGVDKSVMIGGVAAFIILLVLVVIGYGRPRERSERKTSLSCPTSDANERRQ